MTPPGVFFLAIFQSAANLKQIGLYDFAICQQLQNVQHQKSEWTAKRIARENNLNEKYVRRAGHFAQGVDAAEEAVPGIKQDSIKPTEKAVAAIARVYLKTQKRPKKC